VGFRDIRTGEDQPDKITVMGYSSESWLGLCWSAQFSDFHVNYPDLAVGDGLLYAAYSDGKRDGKLTVVRYSEP